MNLSGGDGGSLGVSGELTGLNEGAVEDVGDEGVHDGHALLGDTAVGVDLLEDLVDVGGEGLNSLASLLLSVLLGGGGLGGLHGLNSFLSRGLCHCSLMSDPSLSSCMPMP